MNTQGVLVASHNTSHLIVQRAPPADGRTFDGQGLGEITHLATTGSPVVTRQPLKGAQKFLFHHC